MTRRILLGYQLLTGLSDSATGLLLLVAPAFTLHLMRVTAPVDALPYVSYIGAFVLPVGLACFYGAALARRTPQLEIPKLEVSKIETVWLLTAITRASIAVFVTVQVLLAHLEPAWLSVAATDGCFALLQFTGLAKGWLNDVAA